MSQRTNTYALTGGIALNTIIVGTKTKRNVQNIVHHGKTLPVEKGGKRRFPIASLGDGWV